MVTCSVFFSNAQLDSTFSEHFRYDHFTIRSQFGMGKSKFENIFGNEIPKGGFVMSPVLKAEYTKNLNPSMGLVFNAGIGADFYSHRIIFNSVATRMNMDFGFAPEFRVPVKSNFISFSQGMGIKWTSRLTSTYTESDYNNDWTQTNLNFENVLLPYFKSRFTYWIPFKNKDLLSFNLDYQYVTKDLFRGQYLINKEEQFSAGNIRANRSIFSIGVGYTFTMHRRNEQLRTIISQKGIDNELAKKELKTQRRFVHPKTTMIGVNSGFFMNVTKVNDPGGVFDSYSAPSWNVALSFEQGWKNNFYLQGGFSVSSYWSWFKYDKYSFGASGSSAFLAYTPSVGIMKRINTKNNRNLVNLSAGLNLSFQFEPKGDGFSSGGGELADSTGVVLGYSYMDKVHRTIFPTTYFGIGKDFRMTKNLSFTIDYRFQLGLMKVQSSKINYYESDQVIKEADMKIDGTAHTINFGLKYRFLQEKYKD